MPRSILTSRRIITFFTILFVGLSITSIVWFERYVRYRDEERQFLATKLDGHIKKVCWTKSGQPIFVELTLDNPYKDHPSTSIGSVRARCVINDEELIVKAMRELLESHTKYHWPELSELMTVGTHWDEEKTWNHGFVRLNAGYFYSIRFQPGSLSAYDQANRSQLSTIDERGK